VSELSAFTCWSSLTMNEKFQYHTLGKVLCSIENFEFIVCERVQVNRNNSWAMSVLTSSLFNLNTLHNWLYPTNRSSVMTLEQSLYKNCIVLFTNIRASKSNWVWTIYLQILLLLLCPLFGTMQKQFVVTNSPVFCCDSRLNICNHIV